jgi:hypothetical protein
MGLQGGEEIKPNKGKEAQKQVWLSEQSYATTLLLCYMDAYGSEGLEWDPMTIRHEIEEDFGIKLPNKSFNKLMAAINIAASDQFYTSLPDFIDLCNVLSGDVLDPRWFDPADPSECAWGMTEVMFISPPDKEDENPFSQDIVGYIAEALKSHGIQNPPDVLKVGLRDDAAQIAENVAQTFSDDPEMYSAIWKVQQEKSEDIRTYVKQNLRSLVDQIEKLQLNNGNAADAVKKMAESKL